LHPAFPSQTTITWNITTLKISDDGFETPCCRNCQATLNVHQPDEDRPEHLLGTCAGCGAWYLIELDKEKTSAFMFDLPNVALIHAATAQSSSRSSRKRPPRRMADHELDLASTAALSPACL
jgi:hypothetical protein